MKKFYGIILFLFIQMNAVAQAWQSMADIPEDLAFPVVVELRGNIHVIGGGALLGASDLHLRYTPSTNSWDTLAPAPYLAQQPAGAVLNDKIYFCGGGYPTTGQRLDSNFYYDPDSNLWFQAASLPVATAIHKAVAFDGKMYVMSGQPDKFLCEYYDPVTNSWTQRNPLPDQNFWYGAIAATSNSIFRFGGGAFFAPSQKAHRYDSLNDTWIPLPDLPLAIHAVAGVNIGDSLICISGGYESNYESRKVWIYEINSQVYTFADSLPIARDYHSMVVADSCIYSVGGYNSFISTIGYSLIKNCAISLLTSVSPIKPEPVKPYTTIKSSANLEVHLNSEVLNETAAIKLVDLSGKTVLLKPFNKHHGTVIIDGEVLGEGMYIVLLAIGDRSYTEQWVVSH